MTGGSGVSPDMTVTVGLETDELAAGMRADVARGLRATPKELASKYFYDEEGSALFDAITRLPEYYPTRTERGILVDRADEIAARSGADTVIELGSGTSEKTRLLLDADFAPDRFEHVALFDTEREWIEMRLRSSVDQVVTVAGLDLTVRFVAGEEMRTEISAKFRPDGLTGELTVAGLRLLDLWTDPGDDFALSLSTPK